MSRSTRFSFQLILAALTLAGSAVVGCSNQSSADATRAAEPDPGTGGDNTPFGGNPTEAVTDASAFKGDTIRGNPLCRVMKTVCMPDDDGYRLTADTSPCATPAADAGAVIAGSACRLAKSTKDGSPVPTCSTASSGGDGASCQSGTDCAAGYDCVTDAKNVKTCRHYCCSGSCKDSTSQNGGTTFCDVQSLVDFALKAPVCMPIKHCTLLGSDECSQNESCGVVTELGEAGCVAIGTSQVGASCDENHCAAGLTCLGLPGSRECYKLCKVGAANECAAPQECKTNTIFKDPQFGICLTPQTP